MKIQKFASIVHKYLALIIGIQIFIWVGTGLFFAIIPIEQIRSEHRVKPIEPSKLNPNDFAGLAVLHSKGQKFEKIELENSPRGPIIITKGTAQREVFDGRTGQIIAPISEPLARQIAINALQTPLMVKSSVLIDKASPEFGAKTAAWKVTFQDGLSLYVEKDSGRVVARRSNLWRVYDFLWSLHIMDYKNHEDFNHPLLILAAILALLTAIGGLILLPFRIRKLGAIKFTKGP